MKKGFTLIELLVVIAIIGILSGVVLTSLGTARNKGSDAAVKGDLDGVRSQAEIVYDNSGQSYGSTVQASGACPGAGGTTLFGDSKIASAISAAKSAGSGNVQCVSSGSAGAVTSWAVAANLKSTSTTFWCVDSNGFAGTTTAPFGGSSGTLCQ